MASPKKTKPPQKIGKTKPVGVELSGDEIQFALSYRTIAFLDAMLRSPGGRVGGGLLDETAEAKRVARLLMDKLVPVMLTDKAAIQVVRLMVNSELPVDSSEQAYEAKSVFLKRLGIRINERGELEKVAVLPEPPEEPPAAEPHNNGQPVSVSKEVSLKGGE